MWLIFPKFWYFDASRWHHLYTGSILIVTGILVLSVIWKIILISIGFWLFMDDVGQHRLQYILNDVNYYSYGHYIGRPVYQLRRWLISKTGWKWLNWF